MKLTIKKIAISFLFFLFLLEMGLRLFLGFCDDVLMMESSHFEYIAQPSQHRTRFGNNINYNSFSMRSGEVSQEAVKVLGLGDSVLNGGAPTDQDSLCTTHLSNSLSQTTGNEVQVLNISAGSWGPDNCYAYLDHFGHFDAKMAFLVVSSHDAYDNMDFKKVVDLEHGYRSRQYDLALFELIDRYVLPGSFDHSVPAQNHFNTGFEALVDYCHTNNIRLLIYLHPEISELEKNTFNPQGQEIISFCKRNDIELIKGTDYKFNPGHYRDHIHINEKGQRYLAEVIDGFILEDLREMGLVHMPEGN